MAVGKLVLARAEVEKARELVFSLEAELLLETELLNDIGDFDKKVAKLNCARIDYARKLDLLRRKVMKARGNADRLRLRKKVTNISINTCYESEAVKEGCSFLKSVRRSVLVNGIKTYEDELKEESYSQDEHIKKKYTHLTLIICNGRKTSKKYFNLKKYYQDHQS